jgi:PAS domain S-box-containing protein
MDSSIRQKKDLQVLTETKIGDGSTAMSDMMNQSGPTGGLDVDMLDIATSGPSNSQMSFQTLASPASTLGLSNTTSGTDSPSTAGNAPEIGAGPLPTGFGMPPPANAGSTLTEFTKRRNWVKLILQELRDLMMVLTSEGRIMQVSASITQLTGWEAPQLHMKFIGDFIHHEDRGMFTREFNESIASGNQYRFFYRFKREDGSYAIFEATGHPHYGSDFSLMPGTARNCRGVFMMSRPYPTKTTGFLDSFLEHKIENERLMRRIDELKREEQEESVQTDQHSTTRKDGQSSVTVSDTQRTDAKTDTENGTNASTYDGMPPPPKPSISNTQLTQRNLNEALAASRPDSINDKMARYEGATHLETIEMLTGLRYRDGERSQGISTGAHSPALIKGDVGIAIYTDRDRPHADKKKKLKVADEYVCTDCGTLDSPEWRKGPQGPKTLCNACGRESTSMISSLTSKEILI